MYNERGVLNSLRFIAVYVNSTLKINSGKYTNNDKVYLIIPKCIYSYLGGKAYTVFFSTATVCTFYG